MKKLFLVMAALIFSSALYAVDLDLKAGAMHPTSPNKFGLDTAVAFNYDLNQYFLIGLTSGFGWVNWGGMGLGNDQFNNQNTLYPSHNANLYYVPALATLTVQVQLTEVIPYLSGGIGWGWAWYRETGNNDHFNNYTWQLLGGIKWKFKSSVLFITEMGFRSNEAKNSNNEILSMTGWMGRIGVCIPFSSSQKSDAAAK
jgi:hypothetical protein